MSLDEFGEQFDNVVENKAAEDQLIFSSTGIQICRGEQLTPITSVELEALDSAKFGILLEFGENKAISLDGTAKNWLKKTVQQFPRLHINLIQASVADMKRFSNTFSS